MMAAAGQTSSVYLIMDGFVVAPAQSFSLPMMDEPIT
jgi:hypothetical protein